MKSCISSISSRCVFGLYYVKTFTLQQAQGREGSSLRWVGLGREHSTCCHGRWPDCAGKFRGRHASRCNSSSKPYSHSRYLQGKYRSRSTHPPGRREHHRATCSSSRRIQWTVQGISKFDEGCIGWRAWASCRLWRRGGTCGEWSWTCTRCRLKGHLLISPLHASN